MSVGVIFVIIITCVMGTLLGKFLAHCFRSEFSCLLASLVLFAMACLILYSSSKSEFESEWGRELRTDYIARVVLFYTIGVAVGRSLTNILQNCVRMDSGRTLDSSIGFTVVCLLTIILQIYVIRIDYSVVIGNAVGYMLEVVLRKLLVRLDHEHKKRRPILAPIQTSPQTQIQATYVWCLDLQARLQAYIFGQGVDRRQH